MTSMLNFGEFTPGTEVAEAYSSYIRDRIVLIVGVSPESIGKWMALAIARHKPAKLILASRTKSKIEQVVSIIRESGSGIPVNTVVVDLSSQASIRRAAQDVKALTPKLDIVINNAGVNVQDYQLNKEGIEMHFGTNHIGLFLLTNLVMENIKKAAEESGVGGSTRIINLTSAGHRLSPIRFSDYNFKLTAEELPAGERPPSGLSDSITNPEVPYSPFIAYGQSKTANILFSLYLTEHLKERGIVSYSVHPGSIWTGLPRNLDEKSQKAIRATGKNWKTGDQGASTALAAGFDPALNDSQGVYLADCQLATAADFATDPEMADRLWHLSEQLVGEKFDLNES